MTLSLGITAAIMQPVVAGIESEVAKINLKQMEKARPMELVALLKEVASPWRKFLERHAGARELRALERLSVSEPGGKEGESREAGLGVVLGAFVLSELRRAFVVGFVIMLPFLAIDIIAANLLVGMGMFMVSPLIVTLPVKLLLFVVCDGWLLLVESLLLSYRL